MQKQERRTTTDYPQRSMGFQPVDAVRRVAWAACLPLSSGCESFYKLKGNKLSMPPAQV
jgi:hypothetical protein